LTEKKNVGPAKMNSDVYRFVYNNVPRGNEIEHSSVPPAPNGSNPKSHKALVEKKKCNIGEKGCDEEVHGFVASIVEPLPAKKSKVPDLPNGSNPKAFKALTENK
jgi:hypothetical protein